MLFLNYYLNTINNQLLINPWLKQYISNDYKITYIQQNQVSNRNYIENIILSIPSKIYEIVSTNQLYNICIRQLDQYLIDKTVSTECYQLIPLIIFDQIIIATVINSNTHGYIDKNKTMIKYITNESIKYKLSNIKYIEFAIYKEFLTTIDEYSSFFLAASSGSGKTSLIHYIQNQYIDSNIYYIHMISARDLYISNKPDQYLSRNYQQVINHTNDYKKVLFIIDDLSFYFKKRNIIFNHLLLQLLDQHLHNQYTNIVFIAIINEIVDIPSIFLRNDRIIKILQISNLSYQERNLYLKQYITNDKETLSDICDKTNGFNILHLKEVIDQYTILSAIKSIDDIIDQIALFYKITQRNKNIYGGGKRQWSDIIGYEDIKQHVMLIIQQWQLYSTNDVVVPKQKKSTSKSLLTVKHLVTNGILLIGPNGCGKTMMAKTIANITPNLNYFEYTAADIYEQYLGDSEKIYVVFLLKLDNKHHVSSFLINLIV